MQTTQKIALRGVTLVETMVASCIAGVVLAAIAVGGVSLQRTFMLANNYFQGTSDEMLVADYLGRDLRAALTVAVTQSDSGPVLTLTLPSYIDQATKKPRKPTLTTHAPAFGKVAGHVDYGDPKTPVTVIYKTSGQQLVRQVGQSVAIISTSLQDFQLTLADLGSAADVGVRFTSKFARRQLADTSAATSIRSTVYLRNQRRD
ncbi:MAG: hypothetical protein QOE70_6720 [Chthoniobacter sp.]|jgi:Tfp pilus assembly protein PilW|nr:hypothetical protein [Chthoniobacter sp.]